MKKFLELLVAPFKSQLEVSIDRIALAKFVLWLFSRISPAEIAERFDPVLKGKVLFEAIDDKIIFRWLMDVRKWAEEKIKE